MRRRHSIVAFFVYCGLLAALVVGRLEAYKTLKVGLTLSLTGGTSRVPLSLTVRNGLRYFEQWFAGQPDIVVGNETYRLQIDVRDDQSILSEVIRLYTEMLESGEYDYYLGPLNSDFAIEALNVIDGNGLLLQTVASSDEVSVGSQSTFALGPPASKTFADVLLQARLAGAKTYSYIVEDHPYQWDACLGADEWAAEYGYEPRVCNFTLPNSLLGVTNETAPLYPDAMQQLANTCQQDVVILCSYYGVLQTMLERAREIDFNPKLFMIAPITGAYFSVGSLMDYVVGYVSWMPQIRYPDDGIYGTPEQFAADYQAKFNATADSYAAAGATAPLYLWNAIQSSGGSTAWQDVSDALLRSDFSTIYGRAYYNANHADLFDPPMIQWQPAGPTIVAPASVQDNGIIYPVPAWKERQQTTGWMVYYGDVVMTVLASLAIVLSACLVAFAFAKRHTQVMRAAQVEFLAIALFGSVLMYSSIYTWLYYVTDASCLALPWLLCTGFSLIFSCLASKTWRVHRLFYNRQLRAVSTSRWPLLSFLVVSCGLVWLLLAVWTAVDPLTAELVVVDAFRPSLNYYQCHTGDAGRVLLVIIIFIEGVLLVAAAAMAFRVRNVQLLLFNESKFIGFAIYNLIIVSAICIGFQLSSVSHVTFFWLHTSCILVAGLLTVSCIMGPKIYYICRRRAAAAALKSHTEFTSVGSAIGKTLDDDDAESVYSRYQALLSEVVQLEDENSRLREHLDKLIHDGK